MMKEPRMSQRPAVLPGRSAAALVLAVLAGGACDSLLDVDNPNNVKEEDLSVPSAAVAIVNGVLSDVASAYSSFLLDSGAAADELKFTGSRDAFYQIDIGNWTDPNNEFSDATFPLVARARWWSDEAIKRLEAFRADGTLPNPIDLARAYLYAATTYIMIADHYDDFVIGSDRRTCAKEGVPECAPVGEANMVKLYDTAVQYVDKGLAIARAAGNATVELQLMAMRAKANFRKGVWSKINPRGSIAADPLVRSGDAAADAQAVLARVSDINWRWALTYSATTQTSNIGSWVNSRTEFRIGDPYGNPTPNNKDVIATNPTKMKDIIDTGTVSPALDARIREFDGGGLYPPAVVVSAREMHLILAEHALAGGDTQGFATHINHLRSAHGLTEWTGTGGQPSALAMLMHMRQTNLFLQGQRLADHYRFRVPSVDWLAQSEAMRAPGTQFPITRIERDANPNVR